MSKLEKLIERYCPDGVEYYKIKDVYKRIKGTPITAGKMKEIATPDGSVRIFAGGKTVINANEKDIPNANITRVPAVLVQSRGVIDAVYYDKPFTFKNEMWAYTTFNQKSVKYLYYILKSNIQTFRDAASGMGALPQISLGVTEEFEIPVPPLPVQEEIVRVLDAFTELQAELQAELQKRKQQYNFYRDNLLNFKDINRGGQEIKWMKMSEIGNNLDKKRKPITAGKRESGQIPYYGASGIVDYVKDYLFDGDYLLVSEDGANLLTRTYPIAFSIHGKTWVNNHAHVIEFKERATRKYVEYYLNSIDLSPWISAGAQPKLTQDSLNKLTIPVPPLAEQQRIVSILDRFDTLTNDLTSGLPAEIEKRRQQYEFYRDKLLTFKRKKA